MTQRLLRRIGLLALCTPVIAFAQVSELAWGVHLAGGLVKRPHESGSPASRVGGHAAVGASVGASGLSVRVEGMVTSFGQSSNILYAPCPVPASGPCGTGSSRGVVAHILG